MLEKEIKKAVKKRLTALRAYQHWPVMSVWGTVTLDCIACYEGRYIGIETKAPGRKLTPQQSLTMRKIREAGGKVFLIDSLEKVDELTPDNLKG